MPTVTGFIRNTDVRKGTTKQGKPWEKYKATLATDKDELLVEWPFNVKPQVREGDYVELIYNEEKGYNVIDTSSVKRLDPPKPTVAVKTAQQPAASASGTTGFGEFNRKTNPEDASRMSWSAAREHAIQLVGILLSNDALVIPKAQTKAGQAERYDVVTQAVHKLTVEFYNDTVTQRKLATVADAGVVDVAAKGELPAASDDEPDEIDE